MHGLIASLLLALALVGSLVATYQLFRQAPGEDRTYKDRPPRLFRIAWPLIQLLAASLHWAIGTASERRYGVALRRAGQDYALSAPQFFAGKVVSACAAALLGLLVQAMLDVGGIGMVLVLASLAFFYPDLWLAEVTKQRNLAILKALPFFIDLLTLSIEAGLNLSGAIQQAAAKSSQGPLAAEVNRVLRDVRAGKARIDALRDFSQRLDFPPVTSFVSALVQGEKTGSSLGPILRAQAEQRRTERFLRAEKMAMEAPVKMLGPLIFFIFPCTFIVIGFPIAMKFLASGL